MVRHEKGSLLEKDQPIQYESSKIGECASIRVLKSNPKPKEGMILLKKIASLVAPIMRRHGWQLPQLAEMFPDNPNLLGLNINRGQKILVRLRPAHAPDTFLDLKTQLIGTMLHELTHNVHGPHDQKFYAFLDKLQDEYDGLRTSGYSGEGFLSEGKKLSTQRHDSNLPLHLARQKALEQAEKRRRTGLLMGSAGGQRLGGSANSLGGKSQRELLAEAAERRMRDDKQCGHGEAIDAEAEAAKAAKEAIIIDLSSSDSESDQEGLGRKPVASTSNAAHPVDSDSDVEILPSKVSAPASNVTKKRKPSSPPSHTQSQAKPQTRFKAPLPMPVRGWTCSVCTYASNHPDLLQCEMCETLRANLEQIIDEPDKDVWTCHECGFMTTNSRWSCGRCLAIKTSS